MEAVVRDWCARRGGGGSQHRGRRGDALLFEDWPRMESLQYIDALSLIREVGCSRGLAIEESRPGGAACAPTSLPRLGS